MYVSTMFFGAAEIAFQALREAARLFAVKLSAQFQNTASAGFHSDTNLNIIFNLVPGKVVSVALSSSAILVAN